MATDEISIPNINYGDYAVSVKNVNKIYGEQKILDNLTINIPRSKITTILGFSGAGKSTLLKHLLGLIRPTSGIIEVLGQNLNLLSEFQMREFRRHFGMLFQYAALFDNLTAFENVAFPLREFSRLSEEQLRTTVTLLLLSVDIQESAFSKLPSELSGGMRKRVGLARAMALRPEIMLYDEPTTGLDPITTKTVNDLIVHTAENNREMTSIIISHDVKATMRISDYVAFLDRGRIVEYSPVEKFAKSQNLFVRKFLELEGI